MPAMDRSNKAVFCNFVAYKGANSLYFPQKSNRPSLENVRGVLIMKVAFEAPQKSFRFG